MSHNSNPALDNEPREYLRECYRGLYLVRKVTLLADSPAGLYRGGMSDLKLIYPEELTEALAERADLIEQMEKLGRRGRPVTPVQARKYLALRNDFKNLEHRLDLHDRRCRGAHLALAASFGDSWVDYLRSLGQLLFYIEHSQEKIINLKKKPLGLSRSKRCLRFKDLGRALEGLCRQLGYVSPPEDWSRAIRKEFATPVPVFTGKDSEGLLKMADAVCDYLENYRLSVLNLLLETERRLEEWSLEGETPVAPRPAEAPDWVQPRAKEDYEPADDIRSNPRHTLLAGVLGLAAALLIVFTYWLVQGSAQGPNANLYIFNGLIAAVDVNIDGRILAISPGGNASLKLESGRDYSLKTLSGDKEVESLVFNLDSEPGKKMVYNVAGAAPMMEWLAVYGQSSGQQLEHRLGAPLIFSTRADLILEPPPQIIKISGEEGSRLVLGAISNAHPEKMLALLDEPDDAMGLVEAQARWCNSSSPWLLLWLEKLVELSPQATTILRERLVSFPEDVSTYSFLIKDDPELCKVISARADEAPDNQDRQYLSALCLPQAESQRRVLELLKLWPENPWLNRAAGLKEFDDRNWIEAYHYLKEAFQVNPGSLIDRVEDLARLWRFLGGTDLDIIKEIGPWSPKMRRLAVLEHGKDPEIPGVGVEGAYQLLARGHLEQAVEEVGDSDRNRLIRLAAASDTADEKLATLALEMPLSSGLDDDNVWTMLGLAIKHLVPTAEYEKYILDSVQENELVESVIENLKKKAFEGIAELIRGHEPRFQGQVCLASILAGAEESPSFCRDLARGFLFIYERPYLGGE